MSWSCSRLRILTALTALAATHLATPAWSAWSHPAIAGHFSGVLPPVITTPPAVMLTGNGTDGPLQASAAATSNGVTSTTTTGVTHANGSTVSNVQTVTTYGPANQINVTAVFTPGGDGTPQTFNFTFGNLASPAQSQLVTVGEGNHVTAQPSATGGSNGQVTVSFTDFYGLPINTVTIPLNPPGTTTANAGATTPAPPPPPNFAPSPPPPTPPADDLLALVQAASDEAQQATQMCGVNTPPCIADALDAYADKLEALASRLPPQLRALPAIVRRAAQGVRTARNKTEAVKAVKIAIGEVHKAISLLRAEDPNASIGIRIGRDVDQTLQVAEIKLLRSSGL